METRIEIRTIKDIMGNIYNIYCPQKRNKWGMWQDLATYESLELCEKWHKGWNIVDNSEKFDN